MTALRGLPLPVRALSCGYLNPMAGDISACSGLQEPMEHVIAGGQPILGAGASMLAILGKDRHTITWI